MFASARFFRTDTAGDVLPSHCSAASASTPTSATASISCTCCTCADNWRGHSLNSVSAPPTFLALPRRGEASSKPGSERESDDADEEIAPALHVKKLKV